MKKAIAVLLLIIATSIFIFAGVKLYLIYSEYEKGESEYQDLEQYATVAEEPEQTEEIQEKAEVTEEKKPEKKEESKIPKMDIDFEALKKTNEDFIGWLYYPGLDLNYPIVQGDDNEFYLHHTFEKEKNNNGCIYASFHANPDFTNYNTMIYGHNMRNGSMFGSLKRLTKEPELRKENPDFYIYTPEHSSRYTIYSYYITEPTSDTYGSIADDKEYRKYIKMALKNSLEDCKVDPDTLKPTATLSTCSGSGENKKRLVVHGILAERVDN